MKGTSEEALLRLFSPFFFFFGSVLSEHQIYLSLMSTSCPSNGWIRKTMCPSQKSLFPLRSIFTHFAIVPKIVPQLLLSRTGSLSLVSFKQMKK
jgi:hypothetical protein